MPDPANRLRRIAALNRDRAAVLDKMASIMEVSPGTKEAAEVRASSRLDRRRATLMEQLTTIEAEIRVLDPTQIIAMTYVQSHDDFDSVHIESSDKPLRLVVWISLQDRSMTMSELVDCIYRGGYKTKSRTRDGFTACVQHAIGECKSAGLVSRDLASRQYRAIQVSEEEAASRLHCRVSRLVQV